MDLLAAIKLADDATASPHLQRDGRGVDLSDEFRTADFGRRSQGKVLPATVVAAMEASADRGDLPLTLRAFR